MRTRHPSRKAWIAALLGIAIGGCSPSGGDLEGFGGSTKAVGNTGGNSASGGSHASGGTESASGGSNSVSSGGTVGSGGVTSAGGRSGTGGLVGSGGSSAKGGAVGRDAGPDLSPGSGGIRSGGVQGSGGRASGGVQGTGGSGRAGNVGTAGSTSTGTSSACTPGPALSGGTSHCSSNQSGSAGSMQWTIWSSGSGGCLITYSTAAFSATWNNSGDFLARIGLALGSNKTYDKFGTISVDFAETKSGTGGGYSYIGIYGWSVSPLIEYYVVDDWFSGHPNPGGSKLGTITVDGGTYDVYKHTQVNQPAITGGNQTFDQFFSVRQTARQCGHISLTDHFKQWDSLGLKLGNMEEAKILVEAGGGSGRVDFTTATITAQ